MDTPLLILALFASVLTNLALGLVVAVLVRASSSKRETMVTIPPAGRDRSSSFTGSRRDAILELHGRGLPARTIAAVTGAARGEIDLAVELSRADRAMSPAATS